MAFSINKENTIIQEIVNTYDNIIVDINTTLINGIDSLSQQEKEDAITNLQNNSPKFKDQFVKLVELQVQGIFRAVADEIFNRCYVLVPKSVTGEVNFNDLDITYSDSLGDVQLLKENSKCCYQKGRILFSGVDLEKPLITPCDCTPPITT